MDTAKLNICAQVYCPLASRVQIATVYCMNLFEYLAKLQLANITQNLSNHLTNRQCRTDAPCTEFGHKTVLLSNKSCKLILQLILQYLLTINHPFQSRKLQILVVDFMGTPYVQYGADDYIVRTVRPDIFPLESGNPPKFTVVTTEPLDVIILHGFDLIWHVASVLTVPTVELILNYADIYNTLIVAIRALPTKATRVKCSESNPLLLEIVQSGCR